MPITVSSILQYKHFQRLALQEVLNVQYYVVVAEEGVESDLAPFAQLLFEQYVEELTPFQSSALTHVRGELYEVNGLAFDIHTPSDPVLGLLAGEVMPEFTTFSVQQVRASRATRHGWKRIAGMVEAQQSGGTILGPALAAAQAAAETLWFGEQEWTDPLAPSRNMVIAPIIWGGNDPGYPLGRYSQISNVLVKNRVSTMNTRKVGRGS